jgi:hypothetical protein
MTTAERVRFIQHGTTRLILLDFAGIVDTEEGLAAIARARVFIRALTPDGTHRTLTDVTNTLYNRQIIEAFKGLTVHNRPFVARVAVVSDSTLHRAAIGMIAHFSRRRIDAFKTRDASLLALSAH